MRCYDLTNMNDKTIVDKTTDSLEESCLAPLYENGPLFECDVREAAFNGISDDKRRATIWKMLLGIYPYDPSKWESSHESNIDQYQVFVNEFLTSRNEALGRKNNSFVPNPLDVSWRKSPSYDPDEDDHTSNESKHSREFGDTEVRDIIWKDTQRTYADVEFFCLYNKNVLARMLYVFAKLNAGVQYVQGMNELLAPLLYVFAKAEGELKQEVSIAVEADTFFAFNNLMSETRDLFIRQMDSSSSGLWGWNGASSVGTPCWRRCRNISIARCPTWLRIL